jgi:oxygen-independent coproporphyrinogen III oxidase
MLQWSDQKELIQKYQARVPRYTSYPPATAFKKTSPLIASDVYKSFQRSTHDPISLYIHLPFCETMCHYCGCAAIATKNKNRWYPYVKTLKSEMKQLASFFKNRPQCSQLHWGGGTPNWLPQDLADDLFSYVTDLFPLSSEAEVAIEIDPKTLQRDQLSRLRALGFNRVSFGIQDTSHEVQKAIGRIFPAEEMNKLFLEAHDLKFKSINVDLIYGLPRQTAESFKQTVIEVINMRPQRISLFGYAHVPWIKPHQLLMNASELPSSTDRIIMFTMAADLLKESGYEHLGLDHFVLPEDTLAQAKQNGSLYRNFQGYSVRKSQNLIGLGMSAIGEVQGTFLANHRRLGKYQASISVGHMPIERVYKPSKSERAIANSINEIMCHGKLDLENLSMSFGGVKSLYGVSVFQKLEALRADQLIEFDGRHLKVNPIGRYVLRHIAAALDPMIETEASEESQVQYSRGI